MYDAVRKITVVSIQDMNKECMAVLNQKKVILVNNEKSMRNPASILVIYLTADKVDKCTLVDENWREKEKAKKGNITEYIHPKVASSTEAM